MMNSIIEMNQLKRFLNNEIQSVDPSIITKLQQYDTIQLDAKMYPGILPYLCVRRSALLLEYPSFYVYTSPLYSRKIDT